MDYKMLTPVSFEVRQEYKTGFKQEYLICSDVHFDNPKCKRDLFFKDLDEAKKRNAKVIFPGDFFCLMNGKYDPRRNKSGIRPEYNKANYLDLVIQDAAEKLAPYKDNLLLFSLGNHCTSIINKIETNPLQRLVDALNMQHGANVMIGKYQGFVNFIFTQNKARTRSKKLFFHHGAWGGVITKGALGVTRFAAMVPDADIVISGHTHDRWIMEEPRYRLKANGDVKVENQLHGKSGTYKEEFEQGEGWAVERIVKPKSLGGLWLTFEYQSGEILMDLKRVK